MVAPERVISLGVWAFVATFGFAVLFNVPKRTLLPCAVIGAGGFAIRFTLVSLGVSTEVATYFAALAVGLVGYGWAVRFQLPRLVFTVTGIISMIPGVPAFEVLVYFSQGDTLGGLSNGVRAALITGAIAAGLGTARILTEVEWSHGG